MEKKTEVITDQYGNALQGIPVLITTEAGATATLYADDGVTPIPNPVKSNGNGTISFKAANGKYIGETRSPKLQPPTKFGPFIMFDPSDAGIGPGFNLGAVNGTDQVNGTWFGGAVAKVSALASSIGARLIGFIQAGVGAVARSMQDKAAERVSVYDYATPQQALNCGAKKIYFPAGQYILDGASAQALDVTSYDYGDATLRACLIVPYGVVIETDGHETEFVVTNPAADICAFAIAEDVSGNPSTHSQGTHAMQAFTLRAIGGVGRYGIVTPKKAGLFANKRPKYEFAGIHFCGQNDSKTIFTSPNEGWDIGINIGDSVGNSVFFTGYGTYNATLVDAGQHQMIGCKISAVVGAYGNNIRFIASNMRTFVDIGAGTEGFHVDGSEGQGCWYGVMTTNPTGEPGGFISNTHINTNGVAYSLQNRPEICMSNISAYRSDGYFNHGVAWSAISATDCSTLEIVNLNVNHGTVIGKVNSVGISALRTSFNIANADLKSVGTGIVMDACNDVTARAISINAVANLYALRNASTDINVDMPTIRGVHAELATFFTSDGTIDKTRLYFPQETPKPIKRYSAVAPAAAGTTTIMPRITESEWQFAPSAGAGPYTYDVILDGDSAVAGDEVNIKVVGSASVNPTLRICNRTTASIMSSFTSTAGGKRLVGRYLFDGVNWIERGLYDSVESTY